MRAKFVIDKRENESKKKALLQNIVKKLGTKVLISGENIEVDKMQEKHVVELLMKSGLKFQKAA